MGYIAGATLPKPSVSNFTARVQSPAMLTERRIGTGPRLNAVVLQAPSPSALLRTERAAEPEGGRAEEGDVQPPEIPLAQEVELRSGDACVGPGRHVAQPLQRGHVLIHQTLLAGRNLLLRAQHS